MSFASLVALCDDEVTFFEKCMICKDSFDVRDFTSMCDAPQGHICCPGCFFSLQLLGTVDCPVCRAPFAVVSNADVQITAVVEAQSDEEDEEEYEYIPSSPSYEATSPSYDTTFPMYNPSSPVYTPAYESDEDSPF